MPRLETFHLAIPDYSWSILEVSLQTLPFLDKESFRRQQLLCLGHGRRARPVRRVSIVRLVTAPLL